MHCATCDHENPGSARFCGGCGTPLAPVPDCPACGAANPPSNRFCHACGGALAAEPEPTERRTPEPRAYTPRHLVEKILRSRSALEGERKQVTALFVDVKGSTELQEGLDPEEWHRIMEQFFRVLTEGIHRFEGTVNQYTGDGIMALFGAPVAHEDHAQRACYAGLHLRDQLRRYTDELRLSDGLNFAVRMGMNSGGVVVGKIGDDLRMDYTAQGQTVNLAARMQQLAEPGHIYLTSRTADWVRGYFRLRDVGPLRVKGTREAVHVWDLEEIGTLRTRLDRSREAGFTRFVGRSGEIEMLDLALSRAHEGRGQILGVVAQAGVGKSRLCFEFVERCRHRAIPVWDAHCPSHATGLSYVPIRELGRRFFGVNDEDTTDEIRRKVAGALVLTDESFREALPLAFDFLGVPDPARPLPRMDGEVRRRLLLDLIRRLFEARSSREPAVLLIDDMHWIDAESDRFIAELVETITRTRTVLLTNFRPEYTAEWMRRSDYQQISLQPLPIEATEELMAELLGTSDSLEGLKQEIHGRAGGNPFFIEEIVRELAELGVLEGTRGDYRRIRETATFTIPETVESLLAARIDRLSETEKQVLQAASVIGQEFSERVLSRVCDLPARDLDDAIGALRIGEFFREKALYPQLEYFFAHPLTREVAYSSQLSDRRVRTHAQIAEALEECEADRLDEQSALIAQHWEAAGNPARAAVWYRRAARRETFRDADVALRYWTRAWDLLSTGSPTPDLDRARVETGVELLFGAWMAGTASANLMDVSEQTRVLARRLGDTRSVALATSAFAHLKSVEGDLAGSLADLAEAMRLAEAVDDLPLRINLHQRLGYAHYQAGDLKTALEHTDRGLEICRAETDLRPRFGGYSGYGFLLAQQGQFLGLEGDLGGAESHLREALSVSRRDDDALCIAFSLARMGEIAALRGDLATARTHSEEAVLFAERRLRNVMRGVAYGVLVEVLLEQEEWTAAAEACENVLASMDPPVPYRAFLMSCIALAAAGSGDLERARRAFEEAREITAANPGVGEMLALTRSLTEARALRRIYGTRKADTIREHLDLREARLRSSGAAGLLPFVHEERAELARLLDDARTRDRELREAHRLFARMGATARAERLAGELGL